MKAVAEGLWSRALRVAGARGLLPGNRARLTPAELAAEVARRGDDRLSRLVNGWYYPASYGGRSGTLSDEEAERLVTALEAEIAQQQDGRPERTLSHSAQRQVEDPSPRPATECELCGFPLTTWKD